MLGVMDIYQLVELPIEGNNRSAYWPQWTSSMVLVYSYKCNEYWLETDMKLQLNVLRYLVSHTH